MQKRHLRTIAQLCRAISSQLRHVSTIGRKLVKQQYISHMSLQYGELQPTSGWDRFVSLGTPANSNGFHVLPALLHGTSSGRQPNFASLNRGRHLYLAGRPSRWALAHISGFGFNLVMVLIFFLVIVVWILFVSLVNVMTIFLPNVAGFLATDPYFHPSFRI